MKTLKLSPTGINNFHNSDDLNVRVNGERTADGYTISAWQARKIRNHFCGITDCRCPQGGVVVDLNFEGTEFAVRD